MKKKNLALFNINSIRFQIWLISLWYAKNKQKANKNKNKKNQIKKKNNHFVSRLK